MGRNGPKIVRKLFSISGIEYDLHHIIHNYFAILSKYCGWFEFSYKEQYEKYRLVFSTGKDPKWSVFVQSYVKSILDSLKIIGIKGLEYDGIIVFEFMHKSELPNITVGQGSLASDIPYQFILILVFFQFIASSILNI